MISGKNGGLRDEEIAAYGVGIACLLVLLGIVASFGGCKATITTSPTLTPTQELWSLYGPPIASARAFYENTLVEAGRTAERGLLSDEDLREIVEAAEIVKVAIETAGASLDAAVNLLTEESKVVAREDYIAARRQVLILTALKIAKGLEEAGDGD